MLLLERRAGLLLHGKAAQLLRLVEFAQGMLSQGCTNEGRHGWIQARLNPAPAPPELSPSRSRTSSSPRHPARLRLRDFGTLSPGSLSEPWDSSCQPSTPCP